MAGGRSSSALDIVELFNLETMTSCQVNVDFPFRLDHTGDGNLVCGGVEDINYNNRLSTCYNIVTRETTNLLNARSGHTSWSTNSGIFLLGGFPYSDTSFSADITTEIIIGDSTQGRFGLKYPTRWISIMTICTYWSTIISRYACGFPDEDDNTYIITGGTETLTAVSRYNENGWIEDIPPGLKVQRYLHGCGTYLDDNNIRVSISHLP